MVDNPPADELHSPPRRVTCNAGTLVSGEQAYKNMAITVNRQEIFGPKDIAGLVTDDCFSTL